MINPATGVAATCDPPPASIVGWWAGGGNANDQTGANNGSLQGGATASASGMVGQCFAFNGSSAYVSIPDSAALHPTNFTVEAWVQFSSLDSTASGGSPAGSQYIVFKQNSQTYNFEGIALCKYRTSGGDVFRLTVTSASAQSASVSSTTTISTGVWYHIAAVRGASTLQLYVNGQLQAQTSVSFAQNYGTLPLYFGTSGQSYWDHKFAGSLDEMTLYNRALASNEISAIYAAGSAGKCNGSSAPTITSQPQSQTVSAGANVNFSVTASGTAPLNYQWRFNGSGISGASASTFSLANVQSSQAGNYSVVVANSLGSVTSAVAALTVTVSGGAPTITTQPASQSVTAGATVTFTVSATGTAPLGYQWRFNGTPILFGPTGNSLSLTNVQSAQAGNYSVVVSNSYGSVTSANAALTVNAAGTSPSITTQPTSQTVIAGGSVTFSVAASGTAPLQYQWTFNGSKISGATSSSFTLSSAQSGNAGTYAVGVSNSYGSVTSTGATLSVNSAPSTVVSGSQTYQTIDGFGANINHRSWNNDELKPVINSLINQAGMTQFHVIFDNNNWETFNDNSDANSMNWSYYNTIYSSAEFQKMWGLMGYLNQQGITSGCVPDFEGPSPSWMGGLTLASGMEDEYAEEIASCLVYARKTMGLQFSTVGPVNEPDVTYSGINLSGSSQYVTVMSDLATQLNNNGMSDVKFSGPDLAYTSTSWLQAIMNNSSLMNRFAHFGLHGYQNETPDASGVYNFIKGSSYPATHFWMTEYNVWCQNCQTGNTGDNSWAYGKGTATYMMQLLSEGASAGIVWEGYDSQYVDFNPQTGGNNPPHWSYWGLFAVDNINASPKTYTPRKGFYTLAQIALFVRPGAQRVNVSSPPSGLTMLAFYNANSGQFTITGVNANSSATSLTCGLSSLPTIPTLDLYYTSSSANLLHSGQVAVNNGVFSVSIPADCVFTLTYTNGNAPLANIQSVPVAPRFGIPSVAKGTVALSVSAAPGSNLQIEASADLVTWQVITNIVSDTGTVQFMDPAAADSPRRYYRAVMTNGN